MKTKITHFLLFVLLTSSFAWGKVMDTNLQKALELKTNTEKKIERLKNFVNPKGTLKPDSLVVFYDGKYKDPRREKDVYLFNSNGQITTETIYQADDTKSGNDYWYLSGITYYTYNASGFLTILEFHDYSSGVIVSKDRTVNTYDSNNRLVKTVVSNTLDDNISMYRDVMMMEYTYPSELKSITKQWGKWDGADDWDLRAIIETTYNNQNLPIMALTTNEDGDIYNKTIYEYDTDNNLIRQTTYDRFYDGLRQYSKKEYTYNNGDCVTETYYRDYSAGWEPEIMEEHQYDNNHNILVDKYNAYGRSYSNWILQSRNVYYYKGGTSVPSEMISDNIIIRGLQGAISIENISEPSTISIYDLSGRLVNEIISQSNSLTMEIARGMYIVKINDKVAKVIVK